MHAELKRVFDADQEDRIHHPVPGSEAYVRLRERDRSRRAIVIEVLQGIEEPDAEDLYHAAMVLQHGESVDEIWQAYMHAMNSARLGHRPARWLTAAAYDRWLMVQGKPQKYGTQFVPDGKRHRLWDVDRSTTDEERAIWDVPSLEEQQKRAEELTRTEPMPPMNDAPRWLQDAVKRWSDSEENS